jgi:hypothetical protein
LQDSSSPTQEGQFAQKKNDNSTPGASPLRGGAMVIFFCAKTGVLFRTSVWALGER